MLKVPHSAYPIQAYLWVMLVKTRGIVLRSIKFGDTSLIVDIYCREVGLQSYILNGVRKPKARPAASFFQVMTLLDLVVYNQEKNALKRIKEASPFWHYHHLQQDIRPNAVGLFLIEIVRNTLPHHEVNPDLFDFLEDAFILLDKPDCPLPHFLLQFMVSLTTYIGFQPGGTFSADHSLFDLREGHFCAAPPPYPEYLMPPASQWLSRFAHPEEGQPQAYPDPEVRSKLLQGLLDYYRLHLDHFRPPRSQAILHQILAI